MAKACWPPAWNASPPKLKDIARWSEWSGPYPVSGNRPNPTGGDLMAYMLRLVFSTVRKTAQALAAMIAVLLLCLPLFSQGGETGRISGTVTDQTGGAVAGATVTVTDVARGLSRTLTADTAGLYAAANLIPGAYTVRVEAKGFQALERQNIDVGVGSDNRVDLTLQPGEQTQTITVTGEAPTMNTTNAQTGGTLENNLLANLPINGGSYRNIVQVLPGVKGSWWRSQRPVDQRRLGSVG